MVEFSPLSSSDEIEIIIQANDRASDVLERLSLGLGAISNSALIAQAKMAAFGATLVAAGTSGLRVTAQLGQSILGIRAVLDTRVARSLIDNIKQSASEALTEVQPLSSILGTIAQTSGSFGKGFLGIPDTSILNQFENKFTKISENISKRLVDGFINLPIGKIPFLKKIIDPSQMPVIAGALDQSLSDVLLKRFIGEKIPKALSAVVSRVLGQDLTENLSGVLKNTAVAKALPKSGQELASGSAVKALEVRIASALTAAFSRGFIEVNSTVGRTSFSLGERIGALIVQGATPAMRSGFNILDNILGNSLSSFINTNLPGVGKVVVEKSGAKEAVRSTMGELVNLISGSLVTGLSGNVLGGSAFQGLFQFIGDDVAARGIKSLTNGALVELGKKLADLTFLTRLARTGLENLFTAAAGQGIQSLGGTAVNNLIKAVNNKIPEQVKTVFRTLEAIFPAQIAALKANLIKDVGNLVGGVLKPLDKIITSPARRIQDEVTRLTAIATNQQSESFKKQAADAENAFTAQSRAAKGTARLIRQEIARSQTIVASTTSSAVAKATAQSEIDQLQQELNRRRSENRRQQEEIRSLRSQSASTAFTPVTRAAAAARATRLSQELVDVPTAAAARIETLERFKDTIKSSSAPLAEQARLLAQVDAKIAQVKKGFETFNQSPIERVVNALSTLVSSSGESSKAMQDLKKAFEDVDNALGGSLTEIGKIFGESFREVGSTASRSFSQGLARGIFAGLAPVIDQVDKFVVGIVGRIQSIPTRIAQPLGVVANSFSFLSGLNEPLQVFGAIQSGAGLVVNGLTEIGQQVFFVQSAMQTLQQVTTTGPFQLLIGQNIQLQEQLIATQSSLVGTNKIINSLTGQEVTDPTEAITSLAQPVDSAIERIRQGSLELVGVTSGQLIESFQIIAGQVGQIGISLEQGADLTLSFAAALGTLGVPLFQARQEITSIVQGTIDQNSIVAKTLNLTNQQIQQYKAQGKLFEELTKRLEAYRAGNKLAAQSVGGLSSNIQEIVERVGLLAGKAILPNIITELSSVFEYLKANEEVLVTTVAALAENLFRGVFATVQAIKALFNSTQEVLGQIPGYLIVSFANALEDVAVAVTRTLQILQPFIDVLAKLAYGVYAIGGPFFEIFIQFKALQIGIGLLGGAFGLLGSVLPGIGELLFLLKLRMLPMLQMLPLLSGQLGLGAAGFLLLGQNMGAIPGLAGLVVSRLAGFGPLAPLIAGVIPSVAGIGIQLAGLSRVIPGLGAALTGLFAASPIALARLATVSGSSVAFSGFAPILTDAANRMRTYTQNTDLGTTITNQFHAATRVARIQVRNFLVGIGLLTAGLFAAFYAFDNFILKNKELMESLGAILQGLKLFGEVVLSSFTNPMAVALEVTLAVALAIRLKLIPAILELLAVNFAGFALGLAGLLNSANQIQNVSGLTVGSVGGLARVLNALKWTNMANGAIKASEGLRHIGTAAQLAATSGLPALRAALASGTLGFTSIGGAITSVISGFAALLGPVLLAGAALVATGLYFRGEQLKDSGEAVVEYAAQTDAAGESTIKFAQKLKIAKDRQAVSEAKGIKLSKEEYAENEKLIAQSKLQSEGLASQITTLKEAKNAIAGQGNKDAIEGQIAVLERLQKLLSNLGTGITTAPKELPRLGSTLEQLANTARDAEKAVTQSAGDPAIFKQRAEELIEVTQAERKYGVISAEEAARRLNLITASDDALRDTQIKAQEAITESYKTEADKRISILTSERAVIEANIASGQISEIEGDKQLTANKNKELQIQLENLRQAKAEEARIRIQGLQQTIANNNKLLADAQSRLAVAEGKKAYEPSKDLANYDAEKKAAVEAAKSTEEQISQIQSQRQSGRGTKPLTTEQKTELDALTTQLNGYRKTITDTDGKITAARFKASSAPQADPKAAAAIKKEIDGINADNIKAKANTAASLSQIDEETNTASEKSNAETAKNNTDATKRQNGYRVKELEQSQRKAVDIATSTEKERLIQIQKLENEGVLLKEQADEQRIKTTRDKNKAELASEEIKLKELLKLPALTNPVDEEERQAQIRQSRLKTKDLTIQLLKDERQATEAHIQTLKALLDRRAQVSANLVETQNQQLQRQINLYNVLSKAIDNRNKLLTASRDLASAATNYFTGELNALAELETSEYKRNQLAQTAAAIRLQSLQTQQQYEIESLNLQQEQNKLALEREIIENRIALSKAPLEIRKAQDELDLARKDPKNKFRPEVIEGLELQVQTANDGLKNLAALDSLLISQYSRLPEIQQKEREVVNYKLRGEQSQAKVEYFKTLPPGEQGQIRESLKAQILKGMGQTTSTSDFINQGLTTSRNVQREILGVTPTQTQSNLLSESDPGLADYANVASAEEFGVLAADSYAKQQIKYGPLLNQQPSIQTISAGTQPLQLPAAITEKPSSVSQASVNVINQPTPITIDITPTETQVIATPVTPTPPATQPAIATPPTPAQPTAPSGDAIYKAIFQEALIASNIASVEVSKIPKLIVDEKRLKDLGAIGVYDDAKNQIVITKKLSDILNGDFVGLTNNAAEIGVLIHEIRHALQLKFGATSIEGLAKSLNSAGVDLSQLGETSKRAEEGVKGSVENIEKQVGGKLDPKTQKASEAIEKDAYNFEDKFTPQIVDSVVKSFSLVGDAGLKLQQFGAQVKNGTGSLTAGIDQYLDKVQTSEFDTGQTVKNIPQSEGIRSKITEVIADKRPVGGFEEPRKPGNIDRVKAPGLARVLEQMRQEDVVKERVQADSILSIEQQANNIKEARVELSRAEQEIVVALKNQAVLLGETSTSIHAPDINYQPEIITALQDKLKGVVSYINQSQKLIEEKRLQQPTVTEAPTLKQLEERMFSSTETTTKNVVVSPEVIEPQATKVEAIAPDPTQVKVIAPDPTEVKAKPPNATQVEAVAPTPTQIEAVAPLPTQVKAIAPAATPVEAIAPEPTQIKTIAPDAVTPVVITPSPTAIAVTEPDTISAEVVQPDVIKVAIVNPEPISVDVLEPQSVKPKVINPDIEVSATAQPLEITGVAGEPVVVRGTAEDIESKVIAPDPTQVKAIAPDPTQVKVVKPQTTVVEAIAPPPTPVTALVPEPVNVTAVKPNSVKVEVINPDPIEVILPPAVLEAKTVELDAIQATVINPDPITVKIIKPEPVQGQIVAPSSVKPEVINPEPVEVKATTEVITVTGVAGEPVVVKGTADDVQVSASAPDLEVKATATPLEITGVAGEPVVVKGTADDVQVSASAPDLEIKATATPLEITGVAGEPVVVKGTAEDVLVDATAPDVEVTGKAAPVEVVGTSKPIEVNGQSEDVEISATAPNVEVKATSSPVEVIAIAPLPVEVTETSDLVTVPASAEEVKVKASADPVVVKTSTAPVQDSAQQKNLDIQSKLYDLTTVRSDLEQRLAETTNAKDAIALQSQLKQVDTARNLLVVQTELESKQLLDSTKTITNQTQTPAASLQAVATAIAPAPVATPPQILPLTMDAAVKRSAAIAEPLTLAPASMKTLSLNFESFGNLFLGSVNKLMQTLESGGGGKGITINLSAPITNNIQGGDRNVAQKTGDNVLATLNRVVGQAKNIAKS